MKMSKKEFDEKLTQALYDWMIEDNKRADEELAKMKPIKFSKRHEKRMEKLFEDLRNGKIKPAGN
jgi:hypothetical protein